MIAIGALSAIASVAGQGAPDAPANQRTVLDGVFTAAQADRGGTVYGQKCAECHEGADVDGPPLTGAPFVDRWREDTLDRLFEFIKTRMPQPAPGSLSDAAYVDVVAHLLHENSFPAGQRELTREALASTLLVGPNGPQPLPPGALVEVVGCLTQNAAHEWAVASAARPSRTRVGNEVTAAEATAAERAAPGTLTFTLQNIGDSGMPAPGSSGQKVVIKGALTQRDGVGRIHVTAAKKVADACGG